MDEIEKFQRERAELIASYPDNEELQEAARRFSLASIQARYSYNFDWLGRPIIQYPQDMAAIQELIWEIKPDLVIECGIAHGGSLILSASILALIDYAEAAVAGATIDPRESRRRVLGVDVDIRAHNRQALESHPLSHMLHLIEGSSITEDTIAQVREFAKGYDKVMVFLDSNHTHEHVLAELHGYAHLTSVGSYCVVFDTIVEWLPEDVYENRPWGVGDNPMTAVNEYLAAHGKGGSEPPLFEVVEDIENKLLVTVAPRGYLKRVG